ncbi:hypothetical protein V7087_27285 [Neobacillus niacini]
MFFAYLFVTVYIVGSTWATQAIIKGTQNADEEFLKIHNVK